MRGFVAILVATVAVAFCSCRTPQRVEMVSVEIESWSSAKSVCYNNEDTLSLRNLNIAIRYNDDFKQATLPLKIVVTTPDERHFTDTIELKLQHPSTALAITATESVPYRTNVLLNQTGCYTFAFEPLSQTKGVEAIGIELK